MQRIVGKNKDGANRVYAIKEFLQWDRQFNLRGSQWYTKPEHAIQVSQMRYDKGHTFQKHEHKEYERTANVTQECIVVIQGKIGFKLWDDLGRQIAEGDIGAGQMLIIFDGAHEFTVLEDDTIAVETKNGPYTSVEEDKNILE